MKLKNWQLVNCISKLESFKNVTGLPGMVIGITRRKMSGEVVEYITEQKKIFEKYGTQKEDGWSISKDIPEFDKVMQQLQDMGNLEIEVPVPKFSEEEFMDKFVTDSFSADDYAFLYDLFVRKED